MVTCFFSKSLPVTCYSYHLDVSWWEILSHREMWNSQIEIPNFNLFWELCVGSLTSQKT